LAATIGGRAEITRKPLRFGLVLSDLLDRRVHRTGHRAVIEVEERTI